ncbi:MAG: Rossmann-like and DUF2520 domain-containing protein [Bacteroidales bacterium]
MTVKSINTIVFIGAGNVATHLAKALKSAGKSILQVYSRSELSAMDLARKVNASFTCDISKVSSNADLYIISVSDSSLPVIASELKTADNLIVHTSGFHSMEVIKKISKNIGVFYPVQTFTKNRAVDLSHVPFCIEANSKENLQILETLAGNITSDVRQIDSIQRKKIHLAAVFACNFANYMYHVAGEILKENNISFDILKPLIMETAAKVMDQSPVDVQTGPARRADLTVIEQHLKMLDEKEYRELYEIISRQIIKKSIFDNNLNGG